MIKEEIEEIKDEIKTVKQHSETWELIKYQGEQNAKDKLRQNITIWVLILALFFSNMAWIWYINQYDFSSTSYETVQDGEGTNIISGGDMCKEKFNTESTMKRTFISNRNKFFKIKKFVRFGAF